MDFLTDLLLTPFADFLFMRRALVGIFALSLGSAPLGVFLMFRRMSLAGDAIAHALLPGAAIAYLLSGLSLFAMTLGGFLAGIFVVLLSSLLSRHALVKEDASLAVFYLISLSLGVLLLSLRATPVDLLHILFGSILALDDPTLLLLAGFASLSFLTIVLGLRLFVLSTYDPAYLDRVSRFGKWVHPILMVLLVLNLVSSFHALGTLLSVGMMIMPAATARFWTKKIVPMLMASVLIASTASFLGLIFSWHWNLATGPAMILMIGIFYVLSLLVAPYGPLLTALPKRWHFQR